MSSLPASPAEVYPLTDLHAVGQRGPPGRVQGQVLVRPAGPHAEDVAAAQRDALRPQGGGEVSGPEGHPGERVVAGAGRSGAPRAATPGRRARPAR